MKKPNKRSGMLKKRMSRKKFESYFAGNWEIKANGKYRQNGKFQTAVIGGFKVFKGKGFALRSKSWKEIYDALQLQKLSE